MKTKPLMLALTSAAVLFCGLVLPVSAQPPVPPPAPIYQPLSDQQLDQLLGPIALYPDPLLAIILPAATLPTQIVLADRYVASVGDTSQVDYQPWDASVQALAHYPSVLKYMDDNLAWTTAVGEAFVNQQQEVMESIQRLRLSAQNFGNLYSTPQQQVVNEGGGIEILPADPEVVYVPVYQPEVIYVQSGFSLGFGAACTIGPWLNCDFDWAHHGLRFWDHHHPRPGNWWHERPDQRAASIAQQTRVWTPEDRRGPHGVNRSDRHWDSSSANRANGAPAHDGSNQGRGRQDWQQSQQQPNNTVVNMSHPANVPRPMATPRPSATPTPAVVRSPGAIRTPPAMPYTPPSNSGNGNIGSHNDNPPANNHASGVPFTRPERPEPTHVAPVHSDPPPHSDPPVVRTPPPIQSNSGNNNSGNNGGGGNANANAGSHNSGPPSRR